MEGPGSPAPAPSKGWFERVVPGRREWVFWLAVVLVPPVALGLGAVLFPDLVVDRFLWKHLWGPAVAGAEHRGSIERNGVVADSGYTIVAEVVYGIVLALALFAVYRHVFQRFRVRADGAFIAALIPFVLFGPTVRALQDAEFFALGSFPAYLLITPFIYVWTALWVVALILLGVALARLHERGMPGPIVVGYFALAEAGIVGLHVAYALARPEDFARLLPAAIVLLGTAASVGLYALVGLRRGVFGPNATLAAGGLAFILPVLYLIGVWSAGDAWGTPPRGFHPEAFFYVLMPALVATAVVLGAGVLAGPPLSMFTSPLNLSLVFGQMLDAFATFVALKDPFDLGIIPYSEQHPVSRLFLGIAGGWGFPAVKFVMAVGIVWLIDREFAKGTAAGAAGPAGTAGPAGDLNLVGLVKLAVLVLGLAPGVRDVARVMMGV